MHRLKVFLSKNRFKVVKNKMLCYYNINKFKLQKRNGYHNRCAFTVYWKHLFKGGTL